MIIVLIKLRSVYCSINYPVKFHYRDEEQRRAPTT